MKETSSGNIDVLLEKDGSFLFEVTLIFPESFFPIGVTKYMIN